MPITNLQKEMKATLYERIGSPFWGSFTLSWSLVNYELIGRLFFSDKKIDEKLNLVSGVINDPYLFAYKPLLLTVVFIVIHPLLSTLVFSWQELIKSKKRYIKNKIEKKSVIPVEDYTKLESESSERFSKYNSMITSYENKIDRLISELETLKQSNESYKVDNDSYKGTIAEIESKGELNAQLQQKCASLENSLEEHNHNYKKQQSENEAVDEGNRLLVKRLQHIENYFLSQGELQKPKELKLDIPHLDVHSINRLVHEVKELGFYPIFDGDSKSIKVSVPFYININLLEALSDKYRAERTVRMSN